MPSVHHPERHGVAKAVFRGIRFTVFLVVSCVVSVFLGYSVVRHLAENETTPSSRPAAAVAEGEELRAFANELAGLTGEFIRRISHEDPTLSRAFDRWNTQDFMPRLNDLRLRLQAASKLGDTQTVLLRAADRVAAMAGNPARPHLRQLCTSDVQRAVGFVEERIAELGVAGLVRIPAEPAGFVSSR